MDTFTTAAARRALAGIVRRVSETKQRVVITRYGRPVVAIISVDDPALGTDHRGKRQGQGKSGPKKGASR